MFIAGGGLKCRIASLEVYMLATPPNGFLVSED